MTVRLTTLGGLRGTHNGVEQDWLQTQSLRAAVLTYLAVERSATRDALLTLLWPDADAGSAGHRLSQSIYELRRTLGNDCIQTNGREIAAVREVTADALDFEAAVAEARYGAAIELFHGPFLSGVHLVDTTEFESWVDARRARHARLFRKACREVVQERTKAGDLTAALSAADAWVAVDPIDDEGRHRAIELLALSGRRTEALLQYEAYLRLLQEEGLEPLEETVKMVKALQAQSTAPVLAAKVSPSLAPLNQTLAGTKTSLVQPDRAKRTARLGVDVDPRLDDLVPNFEILRPIGSGAVARVYLARDMALQRLVAIKVLLPELANDRIARRRFEREARAAAKLVHPNIVAVHQVAQLSDGTPFLVMEYVEGRNLADTMAAGGLLAEADACAVLSQTAAALAAAHSRGLIHRDVRPANIVWVRASGRVVLMDFGIVAVVETGTQSSERLTNWGDILGDPAYNSPEQLRGDPVTVASDMYSVGILGYELLTGQGPHAGASGAALLEAHLNRAPDLLHQRRADLNPELADLLQRCLNKTPEHRPSASDAARAFEEILESLQPGRVSAPRAVRITPSSNQSAFTKFLEDLKRREIHKVGSIYIATSLLLLNGGDLILPSLSASRYFDVMVAAVLAGFPVALVVGWMYDINQTGIQRTTALEMGAGSKTHRILGIVGLGLSIILAGIIGWLVLST